MHPSISTSYLLPAILLNPVFFLHSLNTILSRLLPPIAVASPLQPPPYSKLGPSANHPHLDIHASETLCWIYTVLIMIMQMIAFGRISDLREKRRESRKVKERKRTMSLRPDTNREGKQKEERAKKNVGAKDGRDGEALHQQHENENELKTEFSSSEMDSEAAGTDRTTDSEVIL